MRLAAVSPFVDRRHGTERALAELIERLAYQHACEIHLYAQRVEDLDFRSAQASSALPSGTIVWHRVPSMPGPHILQFLVWIFLNGFLRWKDTTFHKLSFDLVLSPGINGFRADVVIVHALFHRLRQLSLPGSRENGSAQTGFLRRLHRSLYYTLLNWMERRVYSNPKVTIATVSRRIAILLDEYFERRDVHVIPNGVDTLHFSRATRLARRTESRKRRNFQDDDFVLLLIGNDWETKGLGTLLEALGILKELPIHLLVVGGDDPSPLQTKAKQLGVLGRCRWEGPTSDVLDVYSAADLYVSPSREDSFGLPVVEAMACGLPAITSIYAGVSDLIRDKADGFVLADPQDSGTLAQLVESIWRDTGFRDNVGKSAAETAQAWSWDRNAEATWKLLNEAMANKG